jgi:hypothetical protein
MIDYKNYKPKKDWTPVIEGVCFVGSLALLAFLYLLIGA